MSLLTRTLCCSAVLLSAAVASATDAPKNSPLGQAGAAPSANTALANLEFSGVSSVGSKIMINLYDRQEKRGFWVEAGKTSGGVTVVSYDNAHDQVTVRVNGAEKTLPLRAPSAVVNGTAAVVPPPPAPAAAPIAPATAPAQPLSQARQEEEARMLVSDLLEIGMAQRRAYEEAQRRAANGQPAATATTPAAADANAAPGQPTGTAQPAAQPAAAPAATTSTPSGG
jgi:hypothetical protein